MKLLFITIVACFLTACNSNSQQKNEDLCAINLNKISNYKAYDASTMGEPSKTHISELRQQAEQYQRQGDIKNCIAVSEQALTILQQYDNK